jgi:MFS family permease
MNKKDAVRIILLFGVISLLGDIIYEGARGVNGPYLKTIGISAAAVGAITGIGEFLGYFVRLLSGYLSDKTKTYWLFTILGYSFLLVVPALSFINSIELIAAMIILERIGKGIRSPAKDTIVSGSTKPIGTGFGFAIVEFLDQIGATFGPILLGYYFLSYNGNAAGQRVYQGAYSLLWIPFVLLMAFLFIAFFLSRKQEEITPRRTESDTLSRSYWLYVIFSFITTTGFVSFAMVGYHLKAKHIISDGAIPLIYALAMVVDAFIGLVIGRLYDIYKEKHQRDDSGLMILVFLPIATALLIPLIFSSSISMIICGIVLWGAVMGAHETIMKAAIADTTTIHKRGIGYGIFNTVYGLAVLIGSMTVGFLYSQSLSFLITIFVCIQILSLIPFIILRFYILHRESK